MTPVLISDCEGPISKNDIALELAEKTITDGAKLFTVVSKYDDFLASVTRKPGYEAGDTLKLILPFLKAGGTTDRKMRDFSAQNLVLVRDAKETLEQMRNTAPTFIVSTSYEHYIRALCHFLAFPFENVYCTRLKIDNYSLLDEERERLNEIIKEIVRMPAIQFSQDTKTVDDLSEQDQKSFQRLDGIFWNEIANMNIGRIYDEISPIGGIRKASAVEEIVKRLAVSLSDVMYIGDSITDEETFKLIRQSGGLTVSFNGNQYAIHNSDIAVMSESSLVTAILAEIYCRVGKKQTLQIVENWSREALKQYPIQPGLLQRFLAYYPTELPKAKVVTNRNKQALSRESTQFRKKVRGVAIGRLG